MPFRRCAPYKRLRPLAPRCGYHQGNDERKQKTLIKKSNAELAEQLTEKEKELQCLQHRQQRIENRRNYLEKADRTKRNHRLITRGAAIEAVFPQVKPLTEVGFYTMVENLAESDDAQSIVADAVQHHEDTTGGDA